MLIRTLVNLACVMNICPCVLMMCNVSAPQEYESSTLPQSFYWVGGGVVLIS